MHSSFVEMEMGSKGSSLRTAEDFVWRKANRPNSRKRNFGVHHKTLRMLDKNYLSSKTSLRTLAWSIDKEGVHGSFANCTGYLQSNCVYSRRLPKGSWFFQLKKVQLQSPGNVLPLRTLHKLKTFFWGQTIHSILHTPHLHTPLGHPLEFPSWKLSVRAALDDVTQTSMPKWMVQRHLSRSDKKSTDQQIFLRRLYDTYVSYEWCVCILSLYLSIYSILVLWLYLYSTMHV